MFTKIQNLYLDYVNNFLTVERFAEYYSLEVSKAKQLIHVGRKVHERHVKRLNCETWAITNEDRTKFLTMIDRQIQWTSNINLAYVFHSEVKATEYEELRFVNRFLNFENSELWYANIVSDLILLENERVAKKLRKEHGLVSPNFKTV